MTTNRAARRAALALAVLLPVLPGGAAASEPATGSVELRADVVSVDPDSGAVVAAGAVRATFDGATLSAESATFDPATGRLTVSGPFRLDTGERTLLGEGLELDFAARSVTVTALETSVSGLLVTGSSARCAAGSCVVEDASATPCPGSPPACGLTARRVTLHPSGDIDLEGPRLELGETTVAALPWLRLRPPGSSGFLPPRLGWSPAAGPVLGPAGQVALGGGVLAGGHFAARGISGFESASRLDFEAGELRVEHLFDEADGHHGRLRLGLFVPLRGAHLAADGDLVTDGSIIDELALDPAERALGHTASRLLLSGGGPELSVESHVAYLQWLDGGAEPRRLLGPAVGVDLALPLLAWELPAWPGLALSLRRVDSVGEPLAPDARGFHAPAHTRLAAAPSVELARRVALFEVGLGASTLHQLWLPDGPGAGSVERHAAGAFGRIELPFEGFPGGLRHRIAPGVRYRLAAPLAGEPPPWLADGRDLRPGGQALDLTLDNGFGDPGDPALAVTVRQRFHLPGFGADPGPAFAELRAGGGPEWLRVDLAAALDERSRRPSLLRAFLSTGDGRDTGLVTGAAWYGPGRGPHLEPGLDGFADPGLAAWPLARPLESLELTEQGSAALGRHVVLHGGARVGLVPAPALHGVWYGLKLRSACDCATVGLLASHRPQTAVPDVLLTLALFER